MYCKWLTVVGVLLALNAAAQGFQETIPSGKYVRVIILAGDAEISWNEASYQCQNEGGNLFTVQRPEDSEWLGQRINYEKDYNLSGRGPSKFWVGLRSYGGSLNWIDGTALNTRDREITSVSGHEDSTKQFAWAVPDGPVNKLKYEFLTADDMAEAYICEF